MTIFNWLSLKQTKPAFLEGKSLALKLNNLKNSAKKTSQYSKHFIMVKIPVIPVVFINNKLISNFKMKADHFNSFLLPTLLPLDNNSEIPGNHKY